jgi:YD repeat-containing protein
VDYHAGVPPDQTAPLGQTTTFTYDPANGNLLTVADAKNQTTTYNYDNMDRLKTCTDAPNRHESYQHHAAGRRTALTYLDKDQHQYA